MASGAASLNTPDALVGRSASEALPSLMAELGDKVFAFSLKFCGNRADAEDLVQETFLQAFRKWDQFEGRSTPSTWLYTIAAHACQRMVRRRSGEPARIDSLDEELPSGLPRAAKLASPEEGPLERELRKETVELVDRAIAALPPDFRLPLVLKEIAGLSLREIARIVDIKEATVKTRVHRGRLALKEALTCQVDLPPDERREHSHQVCLDLLEAKMEALDRGVEFPVDLENLCDRCRDFVDSLDMATEACRWIRGGVLPERLRATLSREFARAAS